MLKLGLKLKIRIHLCYGGNGSHLQKGLVQENLDKIVLEIGLTLWTYRTQSMKSKCDKLK